MRRRAVEAILLAWAATALVSAHQTRETAVATDAATAVVREARALIDAGKATAAIEKLRSQNDTADPRVAVLLGVAYYHANDGSRAIDVLQPLLPRLAPGSAERREAVQVLGLSHYLVGHIAESIPYLEEIRAALPGDIKLDYALARAYAQTRQRGKARESIARSFAVTSDSAAAHLLTGQMMNRLELEDLAYAELKQAQRKDPTLPEVHYLLAQIALFRSRFDEALELIRGELAINPAHAMAMYLKGDAYSRQAKWAEAIAALQQSVWINPYFSGPYILLGKAYLKTAQPGPAEDMLRRAVQYDPNNKMAHYLLAQLLQQTGRIEEARKEFAIAERLQGDLK